jgi:hypothetical protein
MGSLGKLIWSQLALTLEVLLLQTAGGAQILPASRDDEGEIAEDKLPIALNTAVCARVVQDIPNNVGAGVINLLVV